MTNFRSPLLYALFVCTVPSYAQTAPAPTSSAQSTSCPAVESVKRYIHASWKVLTRSHATILASLQDPKVGSSAVETIWIARDENEQQVAAKLTHGLTARDRARIRVRELPEQQTDTPESGLLYLPEPYVVPGGRFNEMYGWDSYFILLGLLADGNVQLAKSMTDNFIYEVEHYGKVLNANRTYYLSRSQPPFLSRMVLDTYLRLGDRKWLEGSLPALDSYYSYWTREPHLTPETGLSRYWGGASDPAPEVAFGERDQSGLSHYDRVREYYRTHQVTEYDVAKYFDAKDDRLTSLFYQGDRAMRESGFDPSGRFGPFSVDIINYDPVDLNSLLYRMEMDLAAIHTLLDQPQTAAMWSARAASRADRINRLMWDERAGLFFDYNFARHERSTYRFLTAFYPLWAGIASAAQAARVAGNLPIWERPGGLATSDHITGEQWDAPFGWAPLQIIAIEGLRRYGFTEAADRLSIRFLIMITKDFAKHSTIKEKYDVEQARSDLGEGVRFGYTSNETGFGWTNAAFLVLLDDLSPAGRKALGAQCPALESKR